MPPAFSKRLTTVVVQRVGSLLPACDPQVVGNPATSKPYRVDGDTCLLGCPAQGVARGQRLNHGGVLAQQLVLTFDGTPWPPDVLA